MMRPSLVNCIYAILIWILCGIGIYLGLAYLTVVYLGVDSTPQEHIDTWHVAGLLAGFLIGQVIHMPLIRKEQQ